MPHQDIATLAKCIYDSCNSFFQQYKPDLPNNDAAKNDVEMALKNFNNKVFKKLTK